MEFNPLSSDKSFTDLLKDSRLQFIVIGDRDDSYSLIQKSDGTTVRGKINYVLNLFIHFC